MNAWVITLTLEPETGILLFIREPQWWQISLQIRENWVHIQFWSTTSCVTQNKPPNLSEPRLSFLSFFSVNRDRDRFLRSLLQGLNEMPCVESLALCLALRDHLLSTIGGIMLSKSLAGSGGCIQIQLMHSVRGHDGKTWSKTAFSVN